VRRLLRAPGFSATVIALPGLPIGANGCLLHVRYGLQHEPLPFADADGLVALTTRPTSMAASDGGMSVSRFEATVAMRLPPRWAGRRGAQPSLFRETPDAVDCG